MKKIFHVILKVLFSLILLLPVISIILLQLGMIPPPTPDYYNTPEAFTFIQILNSVQYINYIMLVVEVIALIALWTRREFLAAILMLPITVNIISFHLILDGGLFTSGALPADVLVLLNIYFLWKNREQFKLLTHKHS